MAEHRDMRASDADRAETVERLQRAATEGRLLDHELDERVEAVLLARTYGELDALVTDLPVAAAPERIDRPRRRRAALLAASTAALAAIAIAVILLASRPTRTPSAQRLPTGYALVREIHIVGTKEHHLQVEIHVVRRPVLRGPR